MSANDNKLLEAALQANAALLAKMARIHEIASGAPCGSLHHRSELLSDVRDIARDAVAEHSTINASPDKDAGSPVAAKAIDPETALKIANQLKTAYSPRAKQYYVDGARVGVRDQGNTLFWWAEVDPVFGYKLVEDATKPAGVAFKF